MEQVNNQEEVSITIKYDEISDAGTVTDECSSAFDTFGFFANNGMMKIEGDKDQDLVKKWFLAGLGPLAIDTRIVAIHKKSVSSLMAKARMDSFNIFVKAVAEKCDGNANVRSAWFGTSRDETKEIVCHGFSKCGGDGAGKLGSHGVQLFPLNSSIDGVLSSELDEKGLRHVLLCRVILGKMEVVPCGSKQFHPSSPEFDSGVDNLAVPSRYTVWTCYMNSHILVEGIISFEIGCSDATAIRTTSPGTEIQTLMAILSRLLHHSKMDLIVKLYDDLHNKKISWQQFSSNLKQLAGAKLLSAVINLYKNKLHLDGSSASSSTSTSVK